GKPFGRSRYEDETPTYNRGTMSGNRPPADPAPLPPPRPVRLRVCPEEPCTYLPGRQTTLRAFWAHHLSGQAYREFMDAGFRRSGRVIYQPICRGCRACIPIRIPVETFRPGKSQRRCWRRNADLTVSVGAPA